MTKDDVSSENLSEKVKNLETELQATKTELIAVNKKLERSERLLEKATNYNEDLRQQLEKLNSQLHTHKISQQNRTDACVQVEEKDLYAACGDKPLPEWNVTSQDGGETVSIADSLKATAEAALFEQSGYVFDQASGLYYDCNSGYYYDANQQLYYDPGSGTYFYYNQTTGQYEFYSQIQTAQVQQTGGDGQTEGLGTGQTVLEESGNSEKSQQKTEGIKKEKKEHRKRRKRKRQHAEESKQHETETSPAKMTHANSVASEDEGTAESVEVEMASGDEGVVEAALESEPKVQKGDCEDSVPEAESSDSLATGESELESGEITSDTSEDEGENKAEETESDVIPTPVVYSAPFSAKEESEAVDELSSNWPPCIRIIATESDCIDAGSFFMITCTGGSIGREKSNTVYIPDVNISKNHAEVSFDYDNRCYVIMDTGSQNGTALNGLRMSLPKQASHRAALGHGDTVQVGGTTLMMHIHPGSDTCDDCEPGQVQARLKAKSTPVSEHVVLTKKQKIRKQREELKILKKKFGLQADHFVENRAVTNNPSYSDRAAQRRQTVGSDVPAAKTEAPASVHVPIAESNKGHKLLSKMGWKEGQGLGKTNTGIAQPIDVHMRTDQSAGLGSASAVKTSLDDVHSVRKSQRWIQAQKRFQKLSSAATELPPAQAFAPTEFEAAGAGSPGAPRGGGRSTARAAKKFGPMSWVSGGTQKPSDIP